MVPGVSAYWETSWDDVSSAMVSSHTRYFRRGGIPQISSMNRTVQLCSKLLMYGVETSQTCKQISSPAVLARPILSMEVANYNVQSRRYAGTIRFLALTTR